MEIWEQHDILFHYTTSNGLMGILESNKLHATHYRYLNDLSEILHLAPKLKSIATPSVIGLLKDMAGQNPRLARFAEKHGGVSALAQSEVSKMVDGLYRVSFGIERKDKFLQPYFVCFCHHTKGSYERDHGLLSQWRAYGQDAGFAIVFDVKRLVERLQSEARRYYYSYGGFGDVVYDGDEEAFATEFDEFIHLVSEQFPKLVVAGKPALDKIFGPFASCAARYKHRAFKEEREVRLTLSPLSKTLAEPNTNKVEKTIKFRRDMTPYIAIFEGEQEKLPITKIIVGPHLEKEVRRDKLARFVDIKGLEIEIACSATPLI
jgi:hypothetical protein